MKTILRIGVVASAIASYLLINLAIWNSNFSVAEKYLAFSVIAAIASWSLIFILTMDGLP